MPDKQPPIPGLDVKGYDLVSQWKRRARRPGEGWTAEHLASLEKRVKALELEQALLKIMMEKVEQ